MERSAATTGAWVLVMLAALATACSSNSNPLANQPKQPVSVLVIGDSLLAIGEPDYQQALENSGIDVVGFYAVAGASIDDLLSFEPFETAALQWTGPSFDEIVASESPDVVYVSFGTNDQHERKGREEGDVVDDAVELLAAFEGSCIVWQTWMSDISHLVSPPSDYGPRLTSFWSWVETQADSVNDFGALLEANPAMLSPDGVHPSAAGIVANAEAMVEAINGCPA